jgi:excinuclease ABC subunit C
MRFRRADYPDKPGVYLMKNKTGKVIYVGKATSLRSRVSSYFKGALDSKTSKMIGLVESIDFLLTKTPAEALILESGLIKSYQPKYNMVLKDDKHYSYLAITDESFPRLIVARKRNPKRKDRFFGPFVEGSKRVLSARFLRKLFMIRTCKTMPKKECLQYHLGNCGAPCTGKMSRSEYMGNVDALESILKGGRRTADVIKSMKKQMERASEKQDYERAAMLRDRMESLSIFTENQTVENKRNSDEDYIWIRRSRGKLLVRILKSRRGMISGSSRHELDIENQDDPEVSFCTQYYADLPGIKVYSNLDPAQIEEINDAIGKKFMIAGPKRKKTLEIARRSLEEAEFGSGVTELGEALHINAPIIIETFDISTLLGKDSVGSMVRFYAGEPDKSGYRRFLIKEVEQQDDYAMMREVVKRRYGRLKKEASPMPDLILIDGGPGQLGSALDALRLLGLSIPTISIAKKEEEIFMPGKKRPLILPKKSNALKLLQRCRDEAHRFAIAYHRKRRSKKWNQSDQRYPAAHYGNCQL